MTHHTQPYPEILNVDKAVLLDNTAIQSARQDKNRFGNQEIEITFTEAGRKRFAEITRQHVHQQLAIIMDEEVLAAPRIQMEIDEGVAKISGVFREDEARDLAVKINQVAVK